MFGERFYPLLRKLSPWKQSLFALVLAQRQYANYLLWTEVNKTQGKAQFNFCLKQLWAFHLNKFNHIDLEESYAVFEPCVPDLEKEADPEDPSTGTLLALDAALAISAAYDAIIMHEGDEAEIASRASMNAVTLAVQNQSEEFLDEEALRETEQVDNEVVFQVDLMELLQRAQRSPELVRQLIRIALKDGCSNIGLSLEEQELSDCSFDTYANAQGVEKSEQKASANPAVYGKPSAKASLVRKDRKKEHTGKGRGRTSSKTGHHGRRSAFGTPYHSKGQNTRPSQN